MQLWSLNCIVKLKAAGDSVPASITTLENTKAQNCRCIKKKKKESKCIITYQEPERLEISQKTRFPFLNIYSYIFVLFFFFKRSLNGSSRSKVQPPENFYRGCFTTRTTRTLTPPPPRALFPTTLLPLLPFPRSLPSLYPPIGPGARPANGGGGPDLPPPPPDSPFAGPGCAG